MADLRAGTDVKFKMSFRERSTGSLKTLTGATMTFAYRYDGGAVTTKGAGDGVAIVDTYYVEYDMPDADLIAGNLEFEFYGTDASGNAFGPRETEVREVRAALA